MRILRSTRARVPFCTKGRGIRLFLPIETRYNTVVININIKTLMAQSPSWCDSGEIQFSFPLDVQRSPNSSREGTGGRRYTILIVQRSQRRNAGRTGGMTFTRSGFEAFFAGEITFSVDYILIYRRLTLHIQRKCHEQCQEQQSKKSVKRTHI